MGEERAVEVEVPAYERPGDDDPEHRCQTLPEEAERPAADGRVMMGDNVWREVAE